MKTEVAKIDEYNIDTEAKKNLAKAGDILRNGGLVAFPQKLFTDLAEMH